MAAISCSAAPNTPRSTRVLLIVAGRNSVVIGITFSRGMIG
jgi:hypothetical protein